MGAFCCKRQMHTASFVHEQIQSGEDDNSWELISIDSNVQHPVLSETIATENTQRQSLHKLRRHVRTIIKLLFVRRLWAALGRWLSTRQSFGNIHVRRVISDLWRDWKTKYVQKYCHIFRHLRRQNSVLIYR